MGILDPDMMYAWEENSALAGIEFKSARVDVLEILVGSTGSTSVQKRTLEPDQIISWIESSSHNGSKPSNKKSDGGALRLILGCCGQPAGRRNPTTAAFPPPNIVPWYFPFSLQCYSRICEKLHLPRATTVMTSRHPESYSVSHFHVYHTAAMDNENEKAIKDDVDRIGITMKLPGFELVGVEATVSLSYSFTSNETNALLLCRSQSQTSYIADMITSLAAVATHPAAIPVMLCSLHQEVLVRKIDEGWNDLFFVETAGGQSGIDIVAEGGGVVPYGNCDDPDLNRKAIEANQLAIAWETYASGEQALTNDIRSFLSTFVGKEAVQKDGLLLEQNTILERYLHLLSQRADSLYYRAKHQRARAELQVSAISNYLAMKIAADAQRDTTIMKSIAVLTMTFLPATYIAALFATPGIASMNPSQGLYWKITVPVTGLVLAIWILWALLSVKIRSKSRRTNLE